MSILIKGMEMPTSCYLCHVRNQGYCGDGMKCSVTGETISWHYGQCQRGDRCPLSPVPKHGRLIDADALERELREDANDLWEQYPHTLTRTTWFEAYEHFADITAAEPTIIEAEGKRIDERGNGNPLEMPI